jgi:K+-sensing histidine kinase KdpD
MRGQERWVWIVTGALGGMALGVLLIPLRTLTSASNLAFVFLAFIIVMAELGGRSAALVTAVVSAMTLDFFLTEPYLTLTISKADDVLAFLALVVCGLIAAAFGRRRGRWSELAARAQGELGVVDKLVEQLRAGAGLDEALDRLRREFRLGAIVLRDDGDRILAMAPRESGSRPLPETLLSSDTLLPADDSNVRFGTRGLRLPAAGGRLTLRSDAGSVRLDLWEGDAQGLDVQECRTLTLCASILALDHARLRAK